MSVPPRLPVAVTLAVGGALAACTARRGRLDVPAPALPRTEFDVTDYIVHGMVGWSATRG